MGSTACRANLKTLLWVRPGPVRWGCNAEGDAILARLLKAVGSIGKATQIEWKNGVRFYRQMILGREL